MAQGNGKHLHLGEESKTNRHKPSSSKELQPRKKANSSAPTLMASSASVPVLHRRGSL